MNAVTYPYVPHCRVCRVSLARSCIVSNRIREELVSELLHPTHRSAHLASFSKVPDLEQGVSEFSTRFFFLYAASRVSFDRYLAATSATISHSAAAYTAYHMVSCLAVTPPGLNTTSEPVELACMNWANATLFVFV